MRASPWLARPVSASHICCSISMRMPLSSISPMDSASNTVVMPLAAICASCAMAAERCGQATFGRGWKYFSMLSVCSSIRPGSR
ncbi:hypothetical protein D9M73_227910 [compost metagenome]